MKTGNSANVVKLIYNIDCSLEARVVCGHVQLLVAEDVKKVLLKPSWQRTEKELAFVSYF